ncbi:MAG: glycosyltransferase [Chloroflexi bacterium]|nr:glycosyltransferase [Chloroflexota bacterium]
MVVVSVVIPAYNEERYLPACLAALRAQDLPADCYEILVVDSASTDATVAIAEHYGARVVQAGPKGPGRGVSYARQRGFEEGRGAIIAFTDADTMPPPHWLRRIVHEFRDPSVVGVYGLYRLIEGGGGVWLWFNWIQPWVLLLHHLLGRPMFGGQNCAVRREALAAIGGFNTALASMEDTDVSIRLRRVGRVVFRPFLMVKTSGRRVWEGMCSFFTRGLRSYINYFFLDRPPSDFAHLR